jgi:hypothetical protein
VPAIAAANQAEQLHDSLKRDDDMLEARKKQFAAEAAEIELNVQPLERQNGVEAGFRGTIKALNYSKLHIYTQGGTSLYFGGHTRELGRIGLIGNIYHHTMENHTHTTHLDRFCLSRTMVLVITITAFDASLNTGHASLTQ